MSEGDDETQGTESGGETATDPRATTAADEVPAEPAPGDTTGDPAFDGPRQLHPLTIPYRLAQQGAGLILFMFFAGVPGLTAMFGGGGGLAAIVGVVALSAAIVGYFVAYYRRFEYELAEDTFDIRSGVFSRREREIPLRRIQNVDISQSVVQRVLGIASVELETAGGGQTEGQLQYVSEDEADRLRAEVSRRRRAGTGEADEEATETTERIFAITERELGVLAVVSTDFRVISLLFFGGSLFGPQAFSFMDETFFAGPEDLLGVLFGPVAGILGVIAIGLVAGLVNAARYYGFTLDRGDEELRYQRGLLQKYSGTIPLSKVQTLTIRENVLARKLGYAALYIETAGYVASGREAGGSQSAIPLAERDRVRDLARTIETAPLDGFERPPKRARLRYAARYALALLGVTGAFYLASLAFEWVAYWWLPLVGLLGVPVAAHLKWANRGYLVADDHVVTRNGFWSRKTKVVPYHRVQTTVSSETIFQRRRDLGTVTVDTAGARSFAGDDAKAVDVDVATMDEIRENVPDRLYAALRKRAGRRRQDRIGVGSEPGDQLATDRQPKG
jgi:putative membrane protein